MAKNVNKISFPGHTGEELSGLLEKPEGECRAYAILAHCFTCSKDLRSASSLSRALALKGIATLRFDFTGLGQSAGVFGTTTFASNLEDLVLAADFLRDNFEAPGLLIGHSLGGTAVLAMAHRVAEVKAVATIGAPSEPAHLGDSLLELNPSLENEACAEVTLAGRTFALSKELVDDLKGQKVIEHIRKLKAALLVMHSPTDAPVGIKHAQEIYQAAKHPKSFISLHGADHLLMKNAVDADYAADVLAAWAQRYLPAQPSKEESTEDIPEGYVRVSIGPEGFESKVRTSNHRWLADEPLSVKGGTDLGPNPYDMLLAALGSCTVMTLRMYANHKGIDLTGVDVELRHERVHAEDCEHCESESGQVDVIHRLLRVEGDLSEKDRAGLHRIADRCPVHRTLTEREIKVTTSLADA